MLDSSTAQRKGSVPQTATTHALAVSLKIAGFQMLELQATVFLLVCPVCLGNTRGAAGTTLIV